MTMFLSLRDAKVNVSFWKSAILVFLLTTTFGVFNEILEFIGQKYTTIVFANSIEDTWLDLTSNTIGILIGIFISLLFINKRLIKSLN